MAPTLRVIRAADCRAMPWKNGGGETTEIAVFPPDAGLDEFEWRVSRARIASDGPFSVFAGVDRTLTVLDGAGLRLVIGAGAPVDLTPSSAPLSFEADVPTRAGLLGGAVTDLNVMTRRGSLRHRVTSLRVEAGAALEQRTVSATVLWFCRAGRARIDALHLASPVEFELGPNDTLLAQAFPAATWRLAVDREAALYLIEIGGGEPIVVRATNGDC